MTLSQAATVVCNLGNGTKDDSLTLQQAAAVLDKHHGG